LRIIWTQVAGTLQLTLNEEAEADKKLTSIAESQVNISAASGQRR
jgi:ferritin-like metal-binding protein YciE